MSWFPSWIILKTFQWSTTLKCTPLLFRVKRNRETLCACHWCSIALSEQESHPRCHFVTGSLAGISVSVLTPNGGTKVSGFPGNAPSEHSLPFQVLHKLCDPNTQIVALKWITRIHALLYESNEIKVTGSLLRIDRRFLILCFFRKNSSQTWRILL